MNMKKTFKLRFLMLTILVVFIGLMLALILFLQTTFLDGTYKNNKIAYLKETAAQIDEGIQNDDILSVLEDISFSNEVCVRVITDAVGFTTYQDASSCALGKLSSKQLNKIATTTFDNGGEALFDSNSSNIKNAYIYSKLSKVNDENVLIMLSTSIVPLQSTIDTMYDQFNIIIIVVVIATILLALCLSSLIVKPIKKIEMEATNLPSGKYDHKLVKTDAREIENLNNTLARANEEIIKADVARKELIGNVSHDLRTPLTMIVGYGEMIRDFPEENNAENINVIINEAKRLSTLVDDLLDLSKVESGKIEFHNKDIKISDLLGSVYDQFEPYCKANNIELVLNIEDSDVVVSVDENRLKQVLHNFMSNALNYNDAKDTKIIIGEEKVDGAYRIYVYDNGSGVKQEDKDKIWNRYYKVDKEHKRSHIGSGIGLSLCKDILDKMGYKYGVDSVYKEYSKFYFDIL